MKKKMLIVNADDFGMSEEISDGIITAHLEGIVTSTSLMVNMPDAKRAVRLAQQTPSLDVGMHLNMTEGHPVLPPEKVPTLVNNTGEFLSDKKIEHYKKLVIISSKNIYKIIIQNFLWHDMISADYSIIISLPEPNSNSLDIQKGWVKILEYLPYGIFEAGCHPGHESKRTKNSD